MIDGLIFLIIAMCLLCVVDFKLTGEIAYLKRSRKKIYKRLDYLENKIKEGGNYESKRNKVYGANSCEVDFRKKRNRK